MKDLHGPPHSSIIIYSDGACRGNPGPGGWGGIIRIGNEEVVEVGGAAARTTNNEMELQAIISSLEFVADRSQAPHGLLGLHILSQRDQ